MRAGFFLWENFAAGSFLGNARGGLSWALKLRFEPGTRVGFESGLQSFWLSRVLREAGLQPEILSANEVRAKASRRGQKTDAKDAFEICDGLRRGIFVSSVFVPEPCICELRSMLSRRRFFVREMTRHTNASLAMLRKAGLFHSQRERLRTPPT